MTLEQLLADWRGDAAVLRRHGEHTPADTLLHLAEQVAEAAEPFLTWLTEADAMRRSGRSQEWLRGRFGEWEREGLARRSTRGKREYRMLVVPRRAQHEAAYQAGRTAGAE